MDNSSPHLKICNFNQIYLVPFAPESYIFTGSRNDDGKIFGKLLFCLYTKTMRTQAKPSTDHRRQPSWPDQINHISNPQSHEKKKCCFKQVKSGVVCEVERAN